MIMKKIRELVLLAVYWLIFLMSFYGAFQLRQYMNYNPNRINVNFLGLTLTSIDDVINLRLIFIMLSILTLLASFAMIYLIVNYNLQVVEKEKPMEKLDHEVKELLEEKKPN